MLSLFAVKAASAALMGAAAVSAHGHTYGINVAGVWYEGYDPTSDPYKAHAPTVVGWTAANKDTGFVAPEAYASGDIICHVDATPARGYASVQAGDRIQVYWTPWPSTHHGPVIDMLANCHGDCTTLAKTDLDFFKIAGAGLVDDATAPGNWATDTLIANNNSWTIQIPADLAEGNYVWRHEIIALHSAEESGGAQNYPQCFNLAVTGAGTLAPTVTPGTALYSKKDAGIVLDIYVDIPTYDIPGPPQIAAGTNLVQSELPITGRSAAYTTGVSGYGSGAAAPTTTAAATTSKPATSPSDAVTSSRAHSTSSAAATSKATTSKATASPSVGGASSRAHSTSSAAAVVKSTSATSNVVAPATATGGYSTGESCKKRPHARGFKA